jgi:hypothetical protein
MQMVHVEPLGKDGQAVSDEAPIRFPDDFRPFEDTLTSGERAEVTRAYDAERARFRRQDSKRSTSAPSPDNPDTRTNSRKPATENEKVVWPATRTTPGQTPVLAREENILAHFLDDFHRVGVVGEECLGQLIYLALTSRMLPWDPAAAVRPVSLLPKGTTSTGKSHVTRTALRFFPPEAWIDLGSISRRYLFYTEEVFAHRFLSVPEWASIKDDEEIVAMLRILLSEGRVIHGTVEGNDGGTRKAKRIEKKGPTGLIVTTADAAIDAEMETRLLTVVTDDTPEQTRRVFHQIAGSQKGTHTLDLERWHEFQTWISDQGETRVYIPFASALADCIPANATRLRRDFGALLNLVRAHAILHQATRQRDDDGDLIATIEGDYGPVRELVGDVIAEGVEASVTDAMRTTVEAVQAILDEGKPHASRKAVEDKLGVGRSSTYDRIRRGLLKGYLINEAGKDERGYKLVVGSPLPGDEAFLPSPADVVRVMSGTPTGQTNPHEQTESRVLSGVPARPADPPDKPALTLLGDEMFPVLLANAVRDGFITHAEAGGRYELHKLVVGDD